MIITHKLKESITKDLDDNALRSRTPSIFLLSKRGHYFCIPSIPSQQISNFCGWLNFIEPMDLQNLQRGYSRKSDDLASYTMYKSIDNIYFTDDNAGIMKPSEVTNRFSCFERSYDKDSMAHEIYTLTKNGLVAEFFANHSYVNIDLDFREIFDFDDKGRIYKIYKERLLDYEKFDKQSDAKKLSSLDYKDAVLLVEYTKYSDNGLKNAVNKHYLAIYGINDEFEVLDRWEKRHYDYDATRNSRSEFFVYHALRILCRKSMKLVFGFSETKEHAIGKVLDILLNMQTIKSLHESYSEKYLEQKYKISELSDPKKAFAYVNALHSLDGLTVHMQLNHKKILGIWAGLPWFFQFWARDELISLRSLILEKRFETAKEILFKHLNEIDSTGRLPNIYPNAGLGSADGIGWLFKRVDEFLAALQDGDLINDYLSLYDLKYLRDRLKFSIKQLQKNYLRDGLVHNNPLETWMDTSFREFSYETDSREGFRIEIQALYLCMLRLMGRLNDLMANKFTKKGDKLVSITESEIDYKGQEMAMRSMVRERFLSRENIGGNFVYRLNDGFNSSYSDVVRPNIFLAYYAYPGLLTDEEWESVFDIAIEKLWCEWKIGESSGDDIAGGFSTIDKTHVLYRPYYTGQDNKSYHRGDSWFYINNLASVCMIRLNKEKYSRYIEMIIQSSAEDILFSGFIGYASEVSSGAYFKSAGCFCQAWSIATFIELMHESYM